MLGRLTPMVKNLIILNLVFYVCTVFIAPDLYDLFALWFFKNPNFEFWQPLTHMFMHSRQSLNHILFNMLWLFILGSDVEQWMGSKKFLFFYIACGIGSFLAVAGINFIQYEMAISELMQQGYDRGIIEAAYAEGRMVSENVRDYWTPMVGASGAIYGIMAGYMLLFANRTIQLLFIPIPIKVKYLIGFFIGKEILATFSDTFSTPGVAHLAHFGGAVFGFIMIWYWKKNDMNKHRIY
ncbi:MAG: rhomboid family intramembrane serine protease [Nonlabens sp.]